MELNVDVKFTGAISEIENFLEETHIFVMSTGDLKEGLGLGIITSSVKEEFNYYTGISFYTGVIYTWRRWILF